MQLPRQLGPYGNLLRRERLFRPTASSAFMTAFSSQLRLELVGQHAILGQLVQKIRLEVFHKTLNLLQSFPQSRKGDVVTHWPTLDSNG